MVLSYPVSKILQVHRRTDRQTDGRTTYDSNTALVLRASRGKKFLCYSLIIPHYHGFIYLLTMLITIELTLCCSARDFLGTEYQRTYERSACAWPV